VSVARFLRAGQRHIEQAAFLLQVRAALHARMVWEELFLQAHDVHVRELQALRAVHRHQAHAVVVVSVVVLSASVSSATSIRKSAACAASSSVLPGLAELLHAVQQFLDVLVAAHALGCLVGVEVLEDAAAACDVLAERVALWWPASSGSS
jgi:hypothetical protein